jgi:hypothetical protein
MWNKSRNGALLASKTLCWDADFSLQNVFAGRFAHIFVGLWIRGELL